VTSLTPLYRAVPPLKTVNGAALVLVPRPAPAAVPKVELARDPTKNRVARFDLVGGPKPDDVWVHT
jgi:hypothetical protein